ncbi:asparagine synthase C-terminal domain-containing protein [uncultured Hyphomonas sp.]|uniref:asparagine synthase C-terminal domain-containing protein n=1 Tax=uncultured Hyphomonas sp. TaxID=225298 RepID=UPI002AAAA722|nr:asparagine synthase C-terminal domain-containing protein [uncultured Hyphomonas sp.]
MPSAFFAMSWDPGNEAAGNLAARTKAKLEARTDPSSCLEAPGFLLADLSEPRGTESPFIAVRRSDGQLGGAVFGTLFPKRGNKRLKEIRHAAATSLLDSCGRTIYRDYWGGYVAFVRTGDDLAIYTDPVASIPCFYWTEDGVTFTCSHLELCPFVDRGQFSLNLRFITALMAYDKIQNGETGLNEVRELLGGQSLMTRPPLQPPDTIWDPRAFAQDVLEPDPGTAANLLRETIEQAVSAWGSCLTAPAVDLSGGLDSSIVLSCLSRSDAAPPVLAVHHVIESGDPPEIAFARATAAYLGADLAEVRFTPSVQLPAPDLHPLSARPYRQFLARDFNTRLAEASGDTRRTYLTGQGGDHLFHAAHTPFGFADHVRRYGFGAGSLQELANAARLSNHSIWQVMRETLPSLLGASRRSPLIAGIDARRTVLNACAHDQFDPAYALPAWAYQSGRLPPGKFDQVSGLLHMMQVQERLFQPDARDLVHPLMSQPIMELCLRLPTYLLSLGGVSRGLVRKAFEGRIPDLVRLRMTKGEATRYFVDQLRANRSLLLDALADGELVSHGIVTRKDVEAFLTEDQFLTHPAGRMILIYYAIEGWLKSWRNAMRNS